MAYRRNAQNVTETVTKPAQTVTNESVTPKKEQSVTKDTFRETLTKTDKTFYDRALRDFKGDPYYKFTDDLREAECDKCGVKFKTGLSLLRYCSYEHYNQTIKGPK